MHGQMIYQKQLTKTFQNIKILSLQLYIWIPKRIDDSSYLEDLLKLYKQQFSNRKFDLVILSDNNAFDFVSKYYDYLFKDAPILFCGINNYNKTILDKLPLKEVSGVAEEVDIEKNFELISKLHPNLKNLLIINDKSITGLAVKKDLNPIIEKYSKNST